MSQPPQDPPFPTPPAADAAPAAVRVTLLPAPAGVPGPLTYAVPPGMAPPPPGACVLVPLATRQLLGYVVGPDEPGGRALKPLLAVVDPEPAFGSPTLALLEWIAAEYLCSLSDALPLAVPQRHVAGLETVVRLEPGWDGKLPGRAGPVSTRSAQAIRQVLLQAGGEMTRAALIDALPSHRVPDLLRRLRETGAVVEEFRITAPATGPRLQKAVELAPAGEAGEEPGRLGPRQKQVLEFLRERPDPARPVPQRSLRAELGVSGDSVRRLEARGLVAGRRVAVRRPPRMLAGEAAAPRLTAAQAEAAAAVARAQAAGAGAAVLLFGVTGSGKTEVYLRAIEAARAAGRTAALLVPEISLTTQVAGRVRARLGDRVAILHSALSDGERFDEWERLRRGEADVAVGPRSALFAPFAEPGLVIIDEEHDGSYKQGDPAPRYHAREVARQRVASAGGALVLGSATPSLESFHRAISGYDTLAELPERIRRRPLPAVTVVDQRSERRGAVFGERLEAALREKVAAGEQAILFLNRRGFSPIVLCRDCGLALRCGRCDVSLTLHQADSHLLLCHHCGYERRVPDTCPRCRGERLHPFGIGTQRVEAAVLDLLPGVRVGRLDRDATRRRGAHVELLDAFRERRIDVLVGTQMVTKGFDFPGVTLVGVVTADVALNTPDFRAAERAFQLLTQVAGRAGRGEQPGEVIVQTFNPEHASVRTAANHDYRGFAASELPHRRELGYPPFGRLARLLVSGEAAAAAEGRIRAAAAELAPAAAREGVELLGPAPAPLSRLNNRYRWHLVLRSRRSEALHAVLAAARPRLHRQVGGVTLDVDPVDLL